MALRKIMLLLVPAMFFLSCKKDKDFNAGIINPIGEREVEMKFLVPGVASTRATIPAESTLKDITLLVFEGNGDASKFLYSRYAWKTSSSATSYKTTLKMGSGQTIYFAANAKQLISSLEENNTLVENQTTWAETKQLLILDTPKSFDLANKGLPMWGYKENVTISDKPTNDLNTVSLLRSVASADITIGALNFVLEKGHLAFAADKGYLAFDKGLINNEGQVSAPQSPLNMTTSVDWEYSLPTGATEILNHFYMYDNDALLDAVGTKRPTKVILEGKWTGGAGNSPTSFYPISFRNKVNGVYEKKQVTRNNKYTIIITNVNGDGWGSLEEAKEADDVNMDYEIIEWNDNQDGEIMIDGPKFFAIIGNNGQKAITLSREVGDMGDLLFRTNFELSDIKMKFNESDTGVSGEIDTHDRFNVKVVSDTDADGLPYTCFRAKANLPYGTMNNPATLTVNVGRLAFKIIIRQLDADPNDWEDGGNQDTDF